MKKIFTLMITLFFSMIAFALPGFTPYLPNNNGDYVYYRDNSFMRESYIGILQYDEKTYQIKYFAPTNKEKQLLEKSIAILVTVDPEKNFLDFTGERIITDILPNSDDTDIINYLHDLLYEFSSRRIKADPILPTDENYKTNSSFWENGRKVKQDYAQFGGSVVIVFDVLVPLFNIKKIIGVDGKDVLELITFGTINSSTDTSFDNFKGLKKFVPQKKEKTISLKKNVKKTEFNFDEKQILLDENWTQTMENLWLLGNSALFSVSKVPVMSEDETQNIFYILRRLISGNEDSYIDVLDLDLKNQKNKFMITSDIYQASTENFIRNVKMLSKNNDGTFSLIIFTVFQKDYKTNKKYFDTIIKQNF